MPKIPQEIAIRNMKFRGTARETERLAMGNRMITDPGVLPSLMGSRLLEENITWHVLET